MREFAKEWTLVNVKPYRLSEKHLYPQVIQAIDSILEQRLEERQLLLPNIAGTSETMCVFSDYGGDSVDADYQTYTFLFCTHSSLGTFSEFMSVLRRRHRLGDKEIAYKDLRYGPINRSLVEYITGVNNFLNGLVFTLIVDKRLTSIIAENSKESKALLAQHIREEGLGEWKPHTVERMLIILHVISYFTVLLSKSGMKLFWMTDNDKIAPNEVYFQHCGRLLLRILPIYDDIKFKVVGTALPFKQKTLEFLDPLSCTDIIAGCMENYFTRTNAMGEEVTVKERVNDVLLWLTDHGVALKKYTVKASLREGQPHFTGVTFLRKNPAPDNVQIVYLNDV